MPWGAGARRRRRTRVARRQRGTTTIRTRAPVPAGSGREARVSRRSRVPAPRATMEPDHTPAGAIGSADLSSLEIAIEPVKLVQHAMDLVPRARDAVWHVRVLNDLGGHAVLLERHKHLL